ncbi:hypothetical protein JANAI62_17770 [Jannaschia pagri]|uniref:Cytochrome c domain-containing protein n=1 Tax=Jannaschia pagri TaxID=2829797 RepID=A0ABQ4NL67_9RHOB|nr:MULTISPECIES: c-type cytochrome [unclassified Jannaschia]GIT91321.1 hypothetical protein JANAI61_17790 [Jannaschia sp. AI_61]GIT95154.1 hypothetical protein JANAI62_17770 [Jannaschia sp. AI_62]
MKALTICLMLCAGVASAQEFTTYKGHGGPIMGLDVSASGQLASASFDNAVGLWSNDRPTWLDGHGAAVNAVLFPGDGSIVSGADDFTVRRWRDSTSEVIGQHQGKVAHLAATPDGAVLASASWDGTIGLWGDVTATLSGHGQGVNTVAFSSDGATLYSGSSDGTIRIWDVASATAQGVLVTHGFGINEMIVGDGWLAYGAVDGGTRVIDLATGAQIKDFSLERRPILSMDYHPATDRIAVGDGHGYIMVIDSAAWRIAQDFRATRQGPVWALAYSKDGGTIHAGGIDDVIYAWPVALLDDFDPAIGAETRPFLRQAETMPNGERQFMRKCSICHALTAGPSRKAGPTLYGVFGRQAGTVPDYRYSPTLTGSDIIWNDTTIDALFDEGPDHYIPGSKMPMQVIAAAQDRIDLIAYLRTATTED